MAADEVMGFATLYPSYAAGSPAFAGDDECGLNYPSAPQTTRRAICNTPAASRADFPSYAGTGRHCPRDRGFPSPRKTPAQAAVGKFSIPVTTLGDGRCAERRRQRGRRKQNLRRSTAITIILMQFGRYSRALRGRAARESRRPICVKAAARTGFLRGLYLLSGDPESATILA
jgi:hypothetical protein